MQQEQQHLSRQDLEFYFTVIDERRSEKEGSMSYRVKNNSVRMKIVMDAMKEGDGKKREERSLMESMERAGVGRIVTSRRRKSCDRN